MTVTVCLQCSLHSLLAGELAPSFEESWEAHEAHVHPYRDASDYEYRQLIEAVWTLDDARWWEVERGLREQGERRDVTHEAVRWLGVLRAFLFSGRLSRAAAHGADPPPLIAISGRRRIAAHGPALPPPIPIGGRWPAAAHGAEKPRRTFPISRPRWWEAAFGTEVPLMFLIKGRQWPAPQGADLPPPARPAWDGERALAALNVTEVPFDATNGNRLGYASGRTIAVSPLSPLPHLTRFHELAHVLLGHTTEVDQRHGELTPRNLQECEAQTVAKLCCAALDLPGVAFSGGYIQHWWGSGKIPRRSAQQILKAVDQILEAGTSTSPTCETDRRASGR
jgi:hypothetical protein